MSRDHRIEGESRRKDRDRDPGNGRAAADERDSDERTGRQAQTSGKTLKTHGIRQDEARRQIRELRSRY